MIALSSRLIFGRLLKHAIRTGSAEDKELVKREECAKVTTGAKMIPNPNRNDLNHEFSICFFIKFI